MAKCSICGTQLANAPSWLDDVAVFTCPDCKSDDGLSAVVAASKVEKKEGCPSCNGTNLVDNDENSLRCDDCGVEICRLCEAELIEVDGRRECKGCGAVYAGETDEDSADEPAMESDDFDS